MSQPNELAWVQAALRGLDLADRIALPLQAPRVALDAYGWTREFWVGAQREFHRALENISVNFCLKIDHRMPL